MISPKNTAPIPEGTPKSIADMIFRFRVLSLVYAAITIIAAPFSIPLARKLGWC